MSDEKISEGDYLFGWDGEKFFYAIGGREVSEEEFGRRLGLTPKFQAVDGTAERSKWTVARRVDVPAAKPASSTGQIGLSRPEAMTSGWRPAQHSPGPWTYEEGSYYIRDRNHDGIIAAAGPGEVDQANLRLAAAAPEMLALLRELDGGCLASNIPCGRCLFCRRRALLAKIDGQR